MYEQTAGGYNFEYPHDPNQLLPPSSVLDVLPPIVPINNTVVLDDTLRATGFSLDELSHVNNASFDLEPHQVDYNLNWDQHTMQAYNANATFASAAAPATPDLLNLLHLPRSVLYDPVGGLGYPAQTHLLRDLFQTLPVGYDGGGVLNHEEEGRQFDSPMFDYRREMKGDIKGNFATEKHRRLQMNNKYSDLKSLIPNPTKSDRASIVMDAIDYIQELQRTVAELKLLIEKKKFGRSKRARTENTPMIAPVVADVESSSAHPTVVAMEEQTQHHEAMFNDQLRSSWLQRRSREALVDVRIVEDEVNVRLTQKKRPGCLLLASKALEELQLDVLHVSGGFIGEHHIFMFNTKILQGSSVYASAVAKKLLEAMERANPPYPPPGF